MAGGGGGGMVGIVMKKQRKCGFALVEVLMGSLILA